MSATPEATAAALEALAEALLDKQREKERYFQQKQENGKAYGIERQRRQDMQQRAANTLAQLKFAEDAQTLMELAEQCLQGIVNDEKSTD